MLDNMSLEDMAKAVDQIAADCIVEASGGITLENVAEVAQSGVDIISIGALTHSSRALDISLDYETKNA
jgi:nicotinate-nucleotide pyrophosphorylase (carboxylating)